MTNATDDYEMTPEVLQAQDMVRAIFDLTAPCARLSLVCTLKLGRARARFGAHDWAAKHYWAEGAGKNLRTVYEFDQPIPAGTVEVLAPIE